MDGYAFVLEALRANDCERLRAYVPREGSAFSTWLLVVARRLALDYYRHRYGRPRSDSDKSQANHEARRRLEDLVADELDTDNLEDDARDAPDALVRREQLRQALRESIGELSEQDRLLLALRFRDGRSISEIKLVLRARSDFQIYRRLYAVLRRLRGALGNRGVDDPDP
jgi:RNA polymerase sigma factor (sigma-70 family)